MPIFLCCSHGIVAVNIPMLSCYICRTEVIKPIAALLSDLDQGPFRVLIIDSIICKLFY